MDLLPFRGKRCFIPFLRRRTVDASFDLGAKREEVSGFEGAVDVSGEHVDLPGEQCADGQNTGSSLSPVCLVGFRPFQNVPTSKTFKVRWTSELFRSAGQWFYWFSPQFKLCSSKRWRQIKPSEPYLVPVLGGEPDQVLISFKFHQWASWWLC